MEFLQSFLNSKLCACLIWAGKDLGHLAVCVSIFWNKTWRSRLWGLVPIQIMSCILVLGWDLTYFFSLSYAYHFRWKDMDQIGCLIWIGVLRAVSNHISWELPSCITLLVCVFCYEYWLADNALIYEANLVYFVRCGLEIVCLFWLASEVRRHPTDPVEGHRFHLQSRSSLLPSEEIS